MDDVSESSPLLERIFAINKIYYVVAVFDIVQSIYFMVQSTTSLVSNVNLITILTCVGSSFWVLMSVLLLVGLWKNKCRLIACWLIFSIIGLVADISFFIWTIVTSEYVKWNEIVHFTVLYLGIVVEWFCVYVIHKFYTKTTRIAQQLEETLEDNVSFQYEFEHPSGRRQTVRPKSKQEIIDKIQREASEKEKKAGKTRKKRDSK